MKTAKQMLLEIKGEPTERETVIRVLKMVKGVTIPDTDKKVELMVNQYLR